MKNPHHVALLAASLCQRKPPAAGCGLVAREPLVEQRFCRSSRCDELIRSIHTAGACMSKADAPVVLCWRGRCKSKLRDIAYCNTHLVRRDRKRYWKPKTIYRLIFVRMRRLCTGVFIDVLEGLINSPCLLDDIDIFDFDTLDQIWVCNVHDISRFESDLRTLRK